MCDYAGFKVVDAGSWNFNDKIASEVKISSRGLIGNDRKNFFKRASVDFEKVFDKIKFGSGDIVNHIIAMGADEKWGPNRNADSFTKNELVKHHNHFVKNSKFYLHHDSRPSEAYGKVAASAYNNDMDRVELLIAGNGTKAAAERNGGKVLPQDASDKMSDGEAAFSMGSIVKTDYCAACNNGASVRPKEYCDEHTCIDKHGKKRFGCKKGLCKVAEDGFVQKVYNPDPQFIDISYVHMPADRTAFGYNLQKIAAFSHTPGGSELAMMRGIIPYSSDTTSVWENTLQKLAFYEHGLRTDGLSEADKYLQYSYAQDTELLPMLRTKQAGYLANKNKLLMQLADNSYVLSPVQYAKFAGYAPTNGYMRAIQNMYGTFYNLPVKTALWYDLEKYAFPKTYASFGNLPVFGEQDTMNRILSGIGRLGGIDGNPIEVKVASAQPDETDYENAYQYSLYKIAALSRGGNTNLRNFILQQYAAL